MSAIIDLKPTWACMTGPISALLESGTFEGRQTARAELAKMGRLADERNALARKIATAIEEIEATVEMHKADPKHVTRDDLVSDLVAVFEILTKEQ